MEKNRGYLSMFIYVYMKICKFTQIHSVILFFRELEL